MSSRLRATVIACAALVLVSLPDAAGARTGAAAWARHRSLGPAVAHLRAQRFAPALRALGRVARTRRAPPPVIAFLRGMALTGLGRHRAAETAFVQAAETPPLAVRAYLMAARASLALEDTGRAAMHASAAEEAGVAGPWQAELDAIKGRIAAIRPAPHGVDPFEEEASSPRREEAAAPSGRADADAGHAVAEPRSGRADALLARALRAYRAGDRELAAALSHQASAAAPRDAEVRLLAGMASARAGADERARAELEAALALGLTGDDHALAQASLEALGTAARGGQPPRLALHPSIAAGYDTNVAQSSHTDRAEGAGGGFLVNPSLSVTFGDDFADGWYARGAYTFDQTVYREAALDEYAFQVHAAEAFVDARLGDAWRVSARAEGDLLFTGVRTFRRFMEIAVAGGALAFDGWQNGTSRLSVEHGWKHASDPEYLHLGGRRLDVRLVQNLFAGPVRLRLEGRRRAEALGTVDQDLGDVSELCPGWANGCDGRYVIPYAHVSWMAGARVRVALGERLRIEGEGAVERRRFSAPSFIALTGGAAADVLNRRVRDDRRVTAGAAVVIRLGAFEVGARHDALVNRSNVNRDRTDGQHPLDHANRNFRKHVVTLELTAAL